MHSGCCHSLCWRRHNHGWCCPHWSCHHWRLHHRLCICLRSCICCRHRHSGRSCVGSRHRHGGRSCIGGRSCVGSRHCHGGRSCIRHSSGGSVASSRISGGHTAIASVSC